MWYAYVLKSQKIDRWYTGSTHDLRKRILRHNAGRNKSTKHGAPWSLIYYEACLNKQDAWAREKYLKSGMGKRYLKNRLKFFFAQGF
ncbi:MAG: GIY-YIG nuclease family protein [Patescibacteria group bacterium]